MNIAVKQTIEKSLFVIIIVVIFYSFGFYSMCIKPKEVNHNYFDSFNLKFKGTVISTRNISHGAGYVCLDLISSNIEKYNPSDSINNYLCLIENNKAIVVMTGIKEFNKNDIFEIRVDSCFLYSKNSILKEKGKLSLTDWIESPKNIDLCE